MPNILSEARVAAYRRDGYVFPIPVMSVDDALTCRRKLESIETPDGGLPGAGNVKPHLLYTFLADLVRAPTVLDAVEDIIGPNILCWASGFFTKECGSNGFVSWHQDSTYWGLSDPDVVTAWIALSPSTPESGCMRVMPGTHAQDQIAHIDTHATTNMLSRGQEIAVDVDESQAIDIVLAPGEMSLHHVRLYHGSQINRSADRRIGYAVRYIPPHIRQINGPADSATLVRGVDRYNNFEHEPRPPSDMHADAVAWHRRAVDLHGQLLFQDSAQRPQRYQ